jgi:hypothetical protein
MSLDGTVSFREEVVSAMKFRTLDRIGVGLTIGEGISVISYYVNSEKSIERAFQLEGPLYPFVTFISGLFTISTTVEITTQFKNYPK